MSGTGYRSRLPYNPGLGQNAPLLVGGLPPTGLDDDFTSEGAAQYAIDGVPQVGFQQMDARWQTYDPDESIGFVGVDARLQMARFIATTEKAWCGLYQTLPPPTAAKPVRQHWVTVRVLLAGVPEGTSLAFGAVHWGLLWSEDLATDPFNSTLRYLGGQCARYAEEGSSSLSAINAAATFLGNNAPAIPESFVDEGLPSGATYYRLRIRQERALDGTFSARVIGEFGTMGLDWFPITEWTNADLAAPAVKHIGFGARASSGVNVDLLCDFFRVSECPIDEYLVLGAVPRVSL